MKQLRALAVCLVALLCAKTGQANTILNGDFENNTATSTQFNMSNAVFDATVANATAFGTAEEIDLITDGSFGIAPESGNWKLGLHTQATGSYDAFSFNLAAPISMGASYNLQFFGALLSGNLGALDVGISNSATDFGTLIFTGTPLSPDAWTQFNTTFTAPVSGSYLTVRTSLIPNYYAFADNFTLDAGQAIPEPASMLLLGSGLIAAGLRRRRAR